MREYSSSVSGYCCPSPGNANRTFALGELAVRILAVSHSAILEVNRELFAELGRRGHRVMLVAPLRWKNDFGSRPLQPEPLGDNGAGRLSVQTCQVIMYGRTAFQFYLSAAYANLLRWRPDVVFIDEEPWSLATLQWATFARLTRSPFIVRTNENRLRTYPWPFSSIYAMVLRHAAWISPVNVYGLDVLKEHNYTGGSSLLPYAVDTNLFHPNNSQVRDPAIFRLGFVGRIAPEKGLEMLLQAAATLVARNDHRRFAVHIYGTGTETYLAALHRAEHDLALPAGMVQWHGAVAHDQAPTAIRSLDTLVVPTIAYEGYKEQFGRVVIEALACQVPVITSDNGELPHLVKETSGGLVFPQGDVGALATCITTAMSQLGLLTQMARRGYDHVRTHYTYSALADRLETVLQQITGATP